jgi:excisionase family DNA binding protein
VDKLLYIHRVAKMLDCSRPMVYKLIYDMKLKAVRVGKRGIRISEASVNEFLKNETVISNDFHHKNENMLRIFNECTDDIKLRIDRFFKDNETDTEILKKDINIILNSGFEKILTG